MRTIVAGAGLVLLAYAVQSALVYALAGPWWALGYLLSLPPSASLDFRFRDRARRAWRRMRAYLHMRARPGFTTWLRSEAAWLAGEAAAIERAVSGKPGNVNDLPSRAAASEAS